MVVCGYWDYDCLSPAFGLISSLFTYTHTHTHTHTQTHPTIHTGEAFAHAIPSAWNALPSFLII